MRLRAGAGRRRRGGSAAWAVTALSALTLAACASEAGEPGVSGPAPSHVATSPPVAAGQPGAAPEGETVEIVGWFNPDLTRGRVRVRIADPVPTASKFVTFASRTVSSGDGLQAWVDGEPVELTGQGSVPFDFATDEVVEVETSFAMWADEPFEVAGRLLADWFPFRTGVPDYVELVHYDVQVWAPTEARIGGDARPCAGEAPGPTDGLTCAARTDRGAPPWVLLPEPGQPEVTGAAGRFRITGALAGATDLAAFGDEAVAELTAILGEVMPERVEVLVGDVAGSFAGQAIGSILMLDRDYVEGSSDAAVRRLIAHELAHTAQDHRTLVSAAEDPGSAIIESMAEYLAFRIAEPEPRAALAAETNRLLQVAVDDFGSLVGRAPLDLLQRVAQVGDANEAYVRRGREQNALRYWYLPRAWAEQEAAWGTERMDEFLRFLHGDFTGGFVLRRVLAAAEQREGGDVLGSWWTGPIPADWDAWG